MAGRRKYKLRPSERFIPEKLPQRPTDAKHRGTEALIAMHAALGNMSEADRQEVLRERRRKAALTRSANRAETIQKRRAKTAGFDSVDAWQGWLRNIFNSGMVRLPKDHPLREAGLVIDPLKYARILLRTGLYVPEAAKARKFIDKYDEPMKAEGFGSFKQSPNLDRKVDLLDPHIGKHTTRSKHTNGD
jgi:hypothetical protein